MWFDHVRRELESPSTLHMLLSLPHREKQRVDTFTFPFLLSLHLYFAVGDGCCTRTRVWALEDAYEAVVHHASGYHVSGNVVLKAVNRQERKPYGVYQQWLAVVKGFNRGERRGQKCRERIAEFLLQTKNFATAAI